MKVTIALAPAAGIAAAQPAIPERARKLHQDVFVFDGHIHVMAGSTRAATSMSAWRTGGSICRAQSMNDKVESVQRKL